MRNEPENYFTYKLSKEEVKYYYSISILSLFTLGYLFYSNIIISLIISANTIFVIKIYKKIRLSKVRKDLNFQFKDLLFSISSSISAGRHIGEALLDAKDNLKLIYREDDYISIELEKISSRIINSKESIELILIDFSKKCDIDDITNFVDILLTCRKTGGDINKVIIKSCNVIMDKISMQKELEMLTAQKKLEGKILAIIPIATIIILRITSQDYISVLYTSFVGRVIMTLALAGMLFAYILIIKITTVDF